MVTKFSDTGSCGGCGQNNLPRNSDEETRLRSSSSRGMQENYISAESSFIKELDYDSFLLMTRKFKVLCQNLDLFLSVEQENFINNYETMIFGKYIENWSRYFG